MTLRFTDEQLQYLSRNFANQDWAIVYLLTHDEDGNPIDFDALQGMIMREIHEGLTMTFESFRYRIARLEGAGAVDMVTGVRDGRSKLVRITPEGYRMYQLHEGGN
ncbi:helix-turn-helix domain-containing protein [Alicyclobacillus ferrooxydans]|uniref:Uncharacterized protein n=1 Tax=Alicyclobacillus ferrooxydans TaxID=471514 RepID=A0A0P9CB57_9BACL|nr:MarR family transcriptional regulator [Alicyclobacillus ferrooxydans]KPV42707.1 hypothetical protein AN477_16390 [Alicyclobacillus ferrooxydans]